MQCLTVFCSAINSADLGIATFAIASSPYLNLSKKISAAQLVAEILIPGILHENESMQFAVIDVLPDFICSVAGCVSAKR